MATPPRTVTALRSEGGGRVVVELDGEPWRTLPLEPVVRARLAVGGTLDRTRARALARELRRGEALSAAGRALGRRDLPARRVDDRLARAGVAPATRRDVLGALERAGLVDDGRYAAARAAELARRGYGDAAVRWDLERRGIESEQAAAALEALEPETVRAARIVAAGRPGPSTARLLARRGFGEDAVEAAWEGLEADQSGADGPAAVG